MIAAGDTGDRVGVIGITGRTPVSRALRYQLGTGLRVAADAGPRAILAQAAQEALAEISVFDRLRSKIGRIIPGL